MGAWKMTKCAIVLAFSLAIGLLGFPKITSASQEEPIIPVSLAWLLGNDKFESGLLISTVGYMESPLLFLTRDHAAILDYPSAINVKDTSSNASIYSSGCSGSYVRIYARNYPADAIKLEFRDVSKIHDLLKKRDCYTR